MAQQRYEKDSLRLSKEAGRWEKTLKHYRGLQAKGVVLNGAQKHKLKSALAALKRVAKEQASLDKKRTDRIKELKDRDKNYDTDLASLEKSLASLPSSQGNHTIAAQRLALKGKIAQLKENRKELQGYTDAPTIAEKKIQDRYSSKEGMRFGESLKIYQGINNKKNEGGNRYKLGLDFNRNINLNLTDQEGTANAKEKLKSIKTNNNNTTNTPANPDVPGAVVRKAEDDTKQLTESEVEQKNKDNPEILSKNTPVTYLPDLADLNRQTGLNIKSDKEWQSLVKSNQVFDTTSMGSKGGYFVNDINDVPRFIKAIKSGGSYA